MDRLSWFQENFCEAVRVLVREGEYLGSRHLMLDAKAGSGKTFIITRAMELLPTSERVIALMFNKRNATDIQKKLPKTGGWIEAKTTHSLGGRVLQKNKGGPLNERKMFTILDEMDLGFAERRLIPDIRKLVSIAKAIGLVPYNCRGAWGLIEDSDETWADLIDHYAIDFDEPWQQERAVQIARDALNVSIDHSGRDGCVEWDDMLYLPVIFRMSFPRYEWVFIDEAQDINPVQREMVQRALAPTGHLIAVGDPNQAIYGFRGADCESMQRIQEEMSAVKLPLSICYRCDREIIREAQTVVPEIEWHDERGEGLVTHGLKGSRAEKLARFTPDAVILCPRNAPLVSAAFGLIRNKIACHMIGRDFADGLVKLLEKLEASTAADAEKKLEAHLEMEIVRLFDKEAQRQVLEDKAATLRVFLEEAPANEPADKIIRTIESLFDENAEGMLTLCSIHKSKGGEWPRVFLMDSDVLGATTVSSLGTIRELQRWEIQQRRNLLYVAITRAEHELVFISSDEMLDALR